MNLNKVMVLFAIFMPCFFLFACRNSENLAIHKEKQEVIKNYDELLIKANEFAMSWQSNAYLNRIDGGISCDEEFNESRFVMGFISKQNGFLSEKLWYALVEINMNAQTLVMDTVDWTEAQPPDDEINWESLVSVDSAITIAQEHTGKHYREIHPDCYITVWMNDDSLWKITYKPEKNIHTNTVVVLVDAKTGRILEQR